MVQNVLQIVHQEIGHADCLYLPGLISVLQSPPDLDILLEETAVRPKLRPGLGTVDDHHVDVVQPHLLQGFVNGPRRRLVGLGLRRHLAGDEQLRPGDAAGTDALAHARLVAVSLGGVNVTVSAGHRLPDGLRRIAVLNEPGPQT